MNLPLESAHVEVDPDEGATPPTPTRSSPPSAPPGTTRRSPARRTRPRTAPAPHDARTARPAEFMHARAWTRSSTRSPGTRWRPATTWTPTRTRPPRPTPAAPSCARRLRVADRADRPGAAAVDDPRAAVHRLAVGRRRARAARRHVGRVAVPPGRVPRRPARRLDHGHARLDRHHRRDRLVAVGAAVRRRGRARHDDDARRCGRAPRRGWTCPSSTSRSPPSSPRSCWPAGTPSTARAAAPATPCARCSTSAPRTCAAGRRHRAARPRRPAARSATSSSSGPARRSPPTASWSAARPRSTPRCSRASPCPVDVGPGDEVTGATINTSGALVVRATRVGAETRLAQIGRLVAAAQTGKAPVQRLADRISAVFVPVVLVLALGTLVAWLADAAPARRRRSPPPSPC